MILKIIKKGEEGCKKFKVIANYTRVDSPYIINTVLESGASAVYYAEPGDMIIFEKEDKDEC